METSITYDGRNELIDCLRALAISFVVAVHANTPLIPGGGVGVSIFFVISGYLMTSILMREGELTFCRILHFIARRIARISPMLIFSVGSLALILNAVDPGRYASIGSSFWSVLRNPTGEGGSIGYGIGVLWTLVIEFWFYLTFPFLLWAALSVSKVFHTFFAIIVLSLAAKIFDVHFSPAAYYDHFIVGALSFAALKAGHVPKILKSKESGAAGLALIMIIGITPYPGYRDAVWFTQSMVAAVGTAMILSSNLRPSMRWAAFVGRISYSIYLVHAIVLDTVPELRQNLPMYLLAVIGISTITYHLIEQPAIRLAHRHFRASSVRPTEKSGLAAKK